MKIPDKVRYFNKHYLNRLTGKIAHSSKGPFSIIYHIGRRSGKQYETPIIAIPLADGFMIALTYGPDVDWYRNITSSGKCRILWHGRESSILKIEPVDAKTGVIAFPAFERRILKWIGIQYFAKLFSTIETPTRN